jgi:hypothetical protein
MKSILREALFIFLFLVEGLPMYLLGALWGCFLIVWWWVCSDAKTGRDFVLKRIRKP